MKTLTLSILLGLTLLADASPTEASYYRFWRGNIRPDLSAEQFIDELNSKIFPATEALFDTSVGLQNYLPTISTERLFKLTGFPQEFALLEYESEEQYRTYRATPEGKAYGDLHWEMFDQATSKSLVPEPFIQTIDFEKAYQVGQSNPDLSQGMVYSRVFMRSKRVLSDPDYLESIRTHMDHLLVSGAWSATLLVTSDYVIEYLQVGSQDVKDTIDQTTLERLTPDGLVTTILDPLSEMTAQKVMDLELGQKRKLNRGQGFRLTHP